MPIPTRVQRLLKSLLTETPDRPMANRGKRDTDVEKLESAGFDVDALMNINWAADDVVTFAIDARYHVVMWLANNSEERAYQHMDFDDFFTGGYRDAKVSKGVVGMDWSKYRMLAKWHAGKFSSGERTTSTLMMGRLWRKTGFVSFWNKKTDVMKEWSLVLDFITNMQLNPKKCAYEFIDTLDIELYDEVVGKTSSVSKNIDPEVLRQMHTSPDLKKAILGTDTGKKKSAMDGYYNHVGDGIIKLGDLLKESPDSPDVIPNVEQVKRMQSLGIDAARLAKLSAYHDSNDAVPFTYDSKGNVILFSVNDSKGNRSSPIHDDLFTTISIFVEHAELFDLKRMPYGWTITPKWNDDGWEDLLSPDDDICPVTFGGMNDETKIRHYVEEVADVLGAPSRRNPRYVFGRMWTKIPAVSFWSTKNQYHERKAASAVGWMLKANGIAPDKAVYEFVDHEDRYFFHDELEAPSTSTMSAAEYKEKLAKQHLDPQAKRDLNKDVEHPDKYGGILPAQYHAWSRQSDGHIKLGDLLKESPDMVLDNDGKRARLFWSDGDNWSFICFPEFSIIGGRKVHDKLINVLLRCQESENLSEYESELTVLISDEAAAMEALLDPNSTVSKVLHGYQTDAFNFRSEVDGVITGRLWADTQIISFWNDQHDVLHNWRMVENMFKAFHKHFDDLSYYYVDWTERDADNEEGKTPRAMVSAEDISHGTFKGNRSPDDPPDQEDLSKVPEKDPKDDSGQLNFLAKMFQEPQLLDKVDDGILKKIRDKVHILDPQAKAQVMKAVGDLPPHKSVRIADALGMSVAEFNHIMHVNESSIQLRNLIPPI